MGCKKAGVMMTLGPGIGQEDPAREKTTPLRGGERREVWATVEKKN